MVPGHEDDLACQLGVFIDDAGEDKGLGVSEEVRARLFDPFYTSKPSGKGTGLGLSISYGIVQRHGGDISVRSRLGEGSTFIISLPTAGQAVPAREGATR